MQLNLNDILAGTGLGGFRTGMSDDRALEMNNRDLMSKDLLNEMQRMKNQDFQAESPLRAVERAYKIAETEKLQAEMAAGKWDEDRQMARNTKQAGLQKTLNENELYTLNKRVTGMEAIHTMFGGTDQVPEPMLVAGWDNARAIGKQHGFDIGEFNEENKKQLLFKIKQTPQMSKFLLEQRKHQEAVSKDELEAERRMAEIRARQSGAMELARVNNAADLEQARVRAAGHGSGDAGDVQKTRAHYLIAIKKKIANGEPISEVELNDLKEDQLVRVMKIVQTNIRFLTAKPEDQVKMVEEAIARDPQTPTIKRGEVLAGVATSDTETPKTKVEPSSRQQQLRSEYFR